MQQLTSERFQTLAAALEWDPERCWLLGARLVEETPYPALAAHTGRSVGALRDEVYRARLEIRRLEEREQGLGEEQAEDEEWCVQAGWAVILWHLTNRCFPLWACWAAVTGWINTGPLPLEEQQALIIYKYTRDQMYAEGKGPAA